MRHLLFLAPLLLALAACGNCQGHATENGPDQGRCTVFSRSL